MEKKPTKAGAEKTRKGRKSAPAAVNTKPAEATMNLDEALVRMEAINAMVSKN